MNRFSLDLRLFVWGVMLIALTSCTPKQGTSRDDLVKWNQATLKGDYDSSGRRNPKWDQDAEDALTQFAQIRTGPNDDLETHSDLVGLAAQSAVESGCNDPMIKYLYCRYASRNAPGTPAERRDEYRLLANDMEGSSYSPVRKFYVNLYAAGMIYQRRDSNSWATADQLWDGAVENLIQIIQDKSVPGEESWQACRDYLEYFSHSSSELTNVYGRIEGPLFKTRPKQATSYLIKAEFYLLYAWRGRGNGNADKVTEQGWQFFRTRLAEAQKALNRAWALDPGNSAVPTLMIQVAEGQQKKRPEMELWFERAMRLDPDNYEACRSKLHYLYPQWYGSREDMVAFGRECVASTNWGGQVPLVLVDAHSDFARFLNDAEDRNAYWGEPDVWPDIKAAYDKYAEVNPDATRFRYPYAAYAFRCGQWQAFNEQIELIRKTGDGLNYGYFGGKDTFDKMVELIKQQTAAPTGS